MKPASRRNFKLILAAAAVSAIITSCTSNLASNAWLLLTDRSNFIPAESSIFFFDPYVIDSGSGGYWHYGKDRKYYYHFTYEPAVPYLYIPIDNKCPHFDRENFRTWCNAGKGKPR